MTQKYNVLYLKSTAALCFGIALPISGLLFVVSFFSDVLVYDMYISPFPLAVALVIWLVLSARILHQNKLLAYQQQILGAVFGGEDAKKISSSSLIYVSDHWLIQSGRLIIHRSFLESVSVRPEHNDTGAFYCILHCVNHKKYRVFVPSSEECKKIVDWYHK